MAKFTESLPIFVKAEKRRITRNGLGDTQIRESFGRAITGKFRENLSASEEECRRHVFVEGGSNWGWLSIPKDQRGSAFFGSKMYPDLAIMGNGFRSALELDHGNNGSQIMRALTKAGFSVILGGYDQAVVFFFTGPYKTKGDFILGDDEARILEIYRSDLAATSDDQDS